MNEFHNFPLDFSFTAPLNSSALPPLRITGDGVLKEFGFEHVSHTCSHTCNHTCNHS